MEGQSLKDRLQGVVNDVDTEESGDCVVVIGKIEGSYLGNLKGTAMDIIRSILTVMAKNEFVRDIINDAANIYNENEEDIIKLVDSNLETESTIHVVKTVGEA